MDDIDPLTFANSKAVSKSCVEYIDVCLLCGEFEQKMLILPQVISNLVLKKEINSNGKKFVSSKQKGVRKQIKKKSRKNVELTLDVPLLKMNNKVPRKDIHKSLKLRNKSNVQHINNGADSVKRKSVRIQQRDGKGIGIEDDRQSEATTNRSLKRQANTKCESFVETLTTKESADVVSETNKQNVDGYMISDKFGTKYDSLIPYCNNNMDNKAIVDPQTTPKIKPDENCNYICSLCSKKFLRSSSLKAHEKTKCNTLKLFCCDRCGMRFKAKKSKENHIRKIHNESVMLGKKKIYFNCNLCDKSLSCKEALINHKRNAHLIQNMSTIYSCETCEKIYKYKCDLTYHIRSHHGDETFVCGDCSDVFKSKRYLINHIRRVHLPTILKCGECSKTFPNVWNLKNHMQSIHSNSKFERGFICETCGKWFSTNFGLQKHLLTHTGEKPYICQVCGKCFRTESNLHQHSRSHSDKRPFSCDLCSKTFRIKHHLRQHMAVHGMVCNSVRRKKISTGN